MVKILIDNAEQIKNQFFFSKLAILNVPPLPLAIPLDTP